MEIPSLLLILFFFPRDSVEKRGIALSSYKDRPEGAYKHLEKLYPEYDRISRRQKTEDRRQKTEERREED